MTTKLYTTEDSADWADFCQGARCGHLEGKGRTGSYVIGEEETQAYEAASANVPDQANRYLIAWAKGYSYGYRLAAEGSELPKNVDGAPLPIRSDIKLSSGRVAKHRHTPNGAQEVYFGDGNDTMTEGEWQEYSELLKAGKTSSEPCPIPGYRFASFDSWQAVRGFADRGTSLYYCAPLDVAPRPVFVTRLFKNGKMRVNGGEVSFTTDEGHLSRFRKLVKA